MRNKINLKLLFLTITFLCTYAILYSWNAQDEPNAPKATLKQVFNHIEGYTLLRHIELNSEAENMLDLDDYYYADYEGKNGKVNLYIGYYNSTYKASAPHSPTICYPSQGWEIESGPIDGVVKFGPYIINYQMITTSVGMKNEIVLYWYQSYLDTNTQNYKNKINIALNSLFHHNYEHCFVRVSVTTVAQSNEEPKEIATDFIKLFYPHLNNYLISS